MASIDKIAIVFSIAIAAIGAGFAIVGDSIDYSPTQSTASQTIQNEPTRTETASTDPFAELADKVKSKAAETEMMESEMMESGSMSTEFEEKMRMEATIVDKPTSTGPKTHMVEIPTGTSVTGCETTDECYLPANITVSAGDTVEWINVDTAAHTVSSGNVGSGPDYMFDSSLIIPSATYSASFDDTGSYDYFCLVHPWMTGTVTVN